MSVDERGITSRSSSYYVTTAEIRERTRKRNLNTEFWDVNKKLYFRKEGNIFFGC